MDDVQAKLRGHSVSNLAKTRFFIVIIEHQDELLQVLLRVVIDPVAVLLGQALSGSQAIDNAQRVPVVHC